MDSLREPIAIAIICIGILHVIFPKKIAEFLKHTIYRKKAPDTLNHFFLSKNGLRISGIAAILWGAFWGWIV